MAQAGQCGAASLHAGTCGRRAPSEQEDHDRHRRFTSRLKQKRKVEINKKQQKLRRKQQNKTKTGKEEVGKRCYRV